MSDEEDVLAAARERADALAAADADALGELLHPAFVWTAHTGLRLDRAAYIDRNTGGTVAWRSQTLVDPRVVVVGDVGVLIAVVEDVVGNEQSFRMPVTTTWVRTEGRWRCLAGHAGPSG